MQTSDARRGELARVDVGNFPHGGIHVLQVLPLHHQDGLGWVEVELWVEKTEVKQLPEQRFRVIAAPNQLQVRCCRFVCRWVRTPSVYPKSDMLIPKPGNKNFNSSSKFKVYDFGPVELESKDLRLNVTCRTVTPSHLWLQHMFCLSTSRSGRIFNLSTTTICFLEVAAKD